MLEPNSSRPTPRSILDRVLIIALLALTFLFGCFRQKDADIWWHLKTGQLILEHGEIPRTDWYTFTSADRPWIDLHWLFQVGAAWLFAGVGLEGLTVASALLGTAAVAVQLAARRRDGSSPVAVACWLATLMLLSGRMYVRPESVTLLCLSLSLAILFRAAERPHRAWWLVAVQVVWVNVQGLFVLGIVLAGVYWLDGVWRHSRRAVPSPLRHRTAVLAAVVGASLANPYHVQGLLFPVELFRKMSADAEFYGARISELESIARFVAHAGPWHFYLIAHFLLLALTVVSFLMVWFQGRFDLFRPLAFAVFAWLSFQATRNSGQFALVAGSVMAWNWNEWAAGRAVHRPPVPLFLPMAGRAGLLGLIALIGVALVSGRFYGVAGEGRQFGLGEHPFWHAHEAARFAARPGMPDRLIAFHLGHAAVFEFHKRAEQRTFCDPRLEVISRELLDEYHQIETAIQRDERGWHGRLARHDLRMILTDHRGSFGRLEATLLADPAWRCVHFDPVASVFLRQDSAESLGLDAIDFVDRYWGAVREATDAATVTVTSDARESLRAARFAEAEALYNLARSLQEKSAGHGRLVQTILLTSLAHAQFHASQFPAAIESQRLLGATSLHLAMQNMEHSEPPDPDDPAWDSWSMFDSARAQYFLHRALALGPSDFGSLSYLYSTAALAKDTEEQRRWGQMLLQSTRAKPTHATFLDHVRRELDAIEAREPAVAGPGQRTNSQRSAAERPAVLAMRRGEPRAAREHWRQALETQDDRRAVIAELIADTYLIERDLDTAIEHYHAALRLESGRPRSHWGLARAFLEKGDSAEVARWCDVGLAAEQLPPAARNAFEWMRQLAQ